MRILMIPAAIMLLAACTQSQKETVTTAENSAQTETIDSQTTVIDDSTKKDSLEVDGITSATALPNHTSYNGVIVVPPQHYSTVTVTMGGTVQASSILPGSYVNKGDILATLVNPDFIDLQQTYLDAHAQAEYLEAEYQRQQRLSEQEAASQKRLQQSKAEYLSMKSRLEASGAQLKILGVSPETLAEKGIQPYLNIHAPQSGYISNLNVNQGKYLNAGETVCDVINKSNPLIKLTAYEKDLGNIQVGNRVQFRVNGMGKETFRATLVSIGQEVDETNRSISIYAQVQGNNNRFRPGMYVTARIEKK